MIRWLDASEHQRFGEALAAFVVEKVPLAPGAKRPRKASPQDVMRKMVQRISDFKGKNAGNFYKKAKFANAFKWKLLEAGYDAEFADELTKELLIHFG